jgi:putative hydrolase of the HAD superfamily
MASKVRAIFFDAGNTLIFPRIDDLAQDLTAQGFPAKSDDFYAAERYAKARLDEWLWPQIRSGQLPRSIDRYYWSEYLGALMERISPPEGQRERLVRRIAEAFRDIQLWSRVFPETPPFLDTLRAQGYFLGVISNSVGTIEQQLDRLDLARRLDAIFDSAIVGVEKPHPEIFRMALARSGVKASEALFIGDTYSTDVGGAQLAGWRGVLIDRVGAYPDAQCPHITALPELRQVLENP